VSATCEPISPTNLNSELIDLDDDQPFYTLTNTMSSDYEYSDDDNYYDDEDMIDGTQSDGELRLLIGGCRVRC
jgi:hypothetical protein